MIDSFILVFRIKGTIRNLFFVSRITHFFLQILSIFKVFLILSDLTSTFYFALLLLDMYYCMYIMQCTAIDISNTNKIEKE